VIDALQLPGPKTKELQKLLQNLGATRKVLLVDAGENRNLTLSSRNLPRVKLVPSRGVNIYDVVKHELLVFSKEAILQVQEVLSR
jgi:large subunit ribosomal protein L4